MSTPRGERWSIILTSLCGVVLVAAPLRAVDDLILNVAPGSSQVMPGSTVMVTLDVANLTTAINGVQARVHFDSTLLTLVDVVPTDLGLIPPAQGWVEIQQTQINGDIDYAIVVNGGSTISNSTVATLVFTAIGEGTTSITFRADSIPFMTKLTLAADNTSILPNRIDSGLIVISCDDGLACTLDTLVGTQCQNTIQPAGTLCRASVDFCDAPELCDGVAATCPPDLMEPAGTQCRASVGLCDPPETCDGLVATCPADVLQPTGTLCRASIGPCDPQETCDGVAGTCPADVVEVVGTSCSDGVFCNGLETCDGLGACLAGSNPCGALICDEATASCVSPLRVENLEVFYAGKFGTCVGGSNNGLPCSADFACVGGVCDLTRPLPDPSRHFLATGSVATSQNITNYVRGITGIRVFLNDLATFPATPASAFTFEWSDPSVCVGGDRDGLVCFSDSDCTGTAPVPNGVCTVPFSPVVNAATSITVTPTVEAGKSVVAIVLADDLVRRRWLKVTISAALVTISGVPLDGELAGNPAAFPSGDGIPGGDAVFYLGNVPGDVDANRKTELTDPGLIRFCTCFNPFLAAPITEVHDVDKDGSVLPGDVGLARTEVNPLFLLPLISP